MRRLPCHHEDNPGPMNRNRHRTKHVPIRRIPEVDLVESSPGKGRCSTLPAEPWISKGAGDLSVLLSCCSWATRLPCSKKTLLSSMSACYQFTLGSLGKAQVAACSRLVLKFNTSLLLLVVSALQFVQSRSHGPLDGFLLLMGSYAATSETDSEWSSGFRSLPMQAGRLFGC